jgi:methionyl-tRNA formyltransferase
MGAELMMVAMARLGAGALVETPQDDARATLAPLLRKESGNLDWTRPAAELRNLIRGVDPWPGAQTYLGGEVLKVWGARLAEGGGTPGEVLGLEPAGLVVACGAGALALGELQLPGRKRLAAAAFVAGHPLPAGTRVGVWPTLA